MQEKKKKALSKFDLYKELLHHMQIMEVFPHYPSDVVHSKEAMVEELGALKAKHLRQLHFMTSWLDLCWHHRIPMKLLHIPCLPFTVPFLLILMEGSTICNIKIVFFKLL
jgi:hypothetical protein